MPTDSLNTKVNKFHSWLQSINIGMRKPLHINHDDAVRISEKAAEIFVRKTRSGSVLCCCHDHIIYNGRCLQCEVHGIKTPNALPETNEQMIRGVAIPGRDVGRSDPPPLLPGQSVNE